MVAVRRRVHSSSSNCHIDLFNLFVDYLHLTNRRNHMNMMLLLRVVRRRQRLIRSMVINMIELWLVQMRVFTPFHNLLDMESDREMIMDVIDVFMIIHAPPSVFWFETGETPESFVRLVALLRHRVECPIQQQEERLRIRRMDVEHEILLTLIWLRHYKTYSSLSNKFGICVSNVKKIISHVIKACSEVLVPREVNWHTLETWDAFRGE